MSPPINGLSAQLASVAGGSELFSAVSENFGFNLKFFGNSVNPSYQTLVLGVFSLILIAVNMLSAKHLIRVSGVLKKKKK